MHFVTLGNESVYLSFNMLSFSEKEANLEKTILWLT